MTFERPEYLAFILILAPMGLFAGIAARAKKNRILHSLGSVALINSFSDLDLGFQKKMIALYLASICLLIVAASGPQIVAPESIKKEKLDLVVVVDVSRSMSAEDFGHGTRLQTAKNIIRKLMERMNGNRIALVTFAGSPFEQAPLTNDYRALRFVINEWMSINSVQKAGSDIISGLATAIKVFDRSDRNKLMLLLTDGGGEIDSKRAMALYKSIRERRIRVVIGGIGSKQGYLLRKSQNDKSLVLTALAEDKLKTIAEACGGTYFNGNADPVRISAGIFSTRVIRANAFEGKQSIYYFPLILAIIAFGIAFKL